MNRLAVSDAQFDIPLLGDAFGPSQSQPDDRHVLLLQGPVGPFFAELQKTLEAQGQSTHRVLFNAADRLMAPRGKNSSSFNGTLATWEMWLFTAFLKDPPKAIVLFGCNRPVHVVARSAAKDFDVPVISLEEGYLRTGFITCESGGNNEHSPFLMGGSAMSGAAEPATPLPLRGAAFWSMRVWATLYYLLREGLSTPDEAALFHRDHTPLRQLVSSWISHATTRLVAHVLEKPQLRRLGLRPGYVLVPLQVSSDSQLQAAARGWSTKRLIDSVLRSQAFNGNIDQIVFKLHPLELGGRKLKQQIMRRARALGFDETRVIVLHSGRIGELARDSSGMIVINSTSAFSALHSRKPVLVLGDAVYRHDSIVTLGESEGDIASFFQARQSKPQHVIDSFLSELRAQCLLPGDFYNARGRKAAIRGIADKLNAIEGTASGDGVGQGYANGLH
ncbi:MAG: hypothetical protein AAFU41_04595 [Pseudomonadota bacterium]